MTTRPMIVCVYLRGAADGLSLVVPHAEDRYYDLRPTLGIPRPDDRSAKPGKRAIDLDGHFGLHPELERVETLFRAGELAIVHAVGSDDQTRSHFEAQDRMEHAGTQESPAAGGWLARHLATRVGAKGSGLAAIAMGTSVPESLRGVAAAVLQSANDYRLGDVRDEGLVSALASLYASRTDATLPFDPELLAAGEEALETLERLRALEGDGKSSVTYPDGQLGRGLREIARLAKADLGVEVACVDYDGWDTHFVAAELVPNLARHLGDSLRAFREDLGDAMDRVVVACITEFGRRAYENASLGTDHGRGGVMFLMGGGLHGGRVIADWPGLTEDHLEPPGDLAVTIDYREILAEILRDKLANTRWREVFPGVEIRDRALFG